MKCKITPENITELKGNEIFVFGSNLKGYHGAGAASTAYRKFGAEMGDWYGFTGNSYAIPTKDAYIKTMSIWQIDLFIKDFKEVVLYNKGKHFLITAIGCGLAGYNPAKIAPMFKDFINYENCSLPQDFIDVIEKL